MVFTCFFSKLSFSQFQPSYYSLVHEARQLYNQKEYREAARTYIKAFLENGNQGTIDDNINAARCWILCGEADSAFRHLEQSARSGFTGSLELRRDPTFSPLYADARWTDFLKKTDQNRQRYELSCKKRYRPLVRMLDTIYFDDQFYRLQTEGIAAESGWSSSKMNENNDIMRNKDSINTAKISSILDKYGWLGKKEIGDRGNSTLFIVIQHTSLPVQLKYLPLLREAVKQGKAQAHSLALLEDRVALKQGKPQIYGSQLGMNSGTGAYYVNTLEDPENVDKRRAAVGLEPMRDYVARFGIKWSTEQYYRDLAANKTPMPFPQIKTPPKGMTLDFFKKRNKNSIQIK